MAEANLSLIEKIILLHNKGKNRLRTLYGKFLQVHISRRKTICSFSAAYFLLSDYELFPQTWKNMLSKYNPLTVILPVSQSITGI